MTGRLRTGGMCRADPSQGSSSMRISVFAATGSVDRKWGIIAYIPENADVYPGYASLHSDRYVPDL